MSERRGPWNSLSQIVGRIEDLESAVAALLALDWQNSVLSRFDPTVALPVGPSDGDRYISLATANGWTSNNIYQWNDATATWDETASNEGYASWVEDENKVYVFNGASWVAIGTTTDHNILANLQGGNGSDQFYHLTQAIHDALYSASPLIGLGAPAGTRFEVDFGAHTIDGYTNNLKMIGIGSTVELYYSGQKTFELLEDSGVPGQGMGFRVFQTAGGAGQDADFVFDPFGSNFRITNNAPSGLISLQATTNIGGIIRDIIDGSADGGASLYHAGLPKITTIATGSDIIGAIGTSVVRIQPSNTLSTIDSLEDGSSIVLRANDSGTALQTLLVGNPDGAAELYNAGELKLSTEAQYLNGVQNASDVALSSDGGTPPTITLTFTGTVYVWSDGIRYAKTGSENIQITDVSGTHVIYYDGDTLTAVANPSHDSVDAIIEDKAIIAIIYWNTNSDTAPVLADELHGIKMPGATHHYLHDTRGSAYEDGAAISGFILNTASDAALTFDLSDLEFYDEDIKVDIIDGLASVQYEQVLTGDAEIPVLYRDAIDQSWVEQAASTLPYLVGGSPRLQYMDKDNSYALTEIGVAKFCSYWLVATNDWQYPIKMIPGDQEYDTANDVENNAPNEIVNFGDLPSAEFIVLYQFVMQASVGGTKNAKIVEIVDYRESGKSGTAANPATDHGGLSGLNDDDHPQYRLVSDAPTVHGNGSHSSVFITAADVTYANLNGNGDVGVGAAQVAVGNHGHAQLHTRLHAITDILDHSAGNWKVVHTNGAGQVVELALGAANTFLQSNGPAAAPSFGSLTPIFGSQFQVAVSEGVSTTSLGTYQQKLRLTTPSLPSGDYMIQYQWEFYNARKQGECRVELNDTTELAYNNTDKVLGELAGNYMLKNGFDVRTLSGVNTIDIDYLSSTGVDLMSIRRARITIWRVS